MNRAALWFKTAAPIAVFSMMAALAMTQTSAVSRAISAPFAARPISAPAPAAAPARAQSKPMVKALAPASIGSTAFWVAAAPIPFGAALSARF